MIKLWKRTTPTISDDGYEGLLSIYSNGRLQQKEIRTNIRRGLKIRKNYMTLLLETEKILSDRHISPELERSTRVHQQTLLQETANVNGMLEDCLNLQRSIERNLRNAHLAERTIIKYICSNAMSYETLSAALGTSDANYLWRRAIITGWRWFPNQTFPTQGFVDLFMRLVHTRTESYEALRENLETVRESDIARFGEAIANCLYWYGAIASLWPLLANKIRNLAFFTGISAAIHWLRSNLGL